jgi:hydroxymethylpyrimidine pyrophosphatase-like HAD family hydrolase
LHKEDSISFGDDIQDVSMGQATEAFVCMGQGHEKAKKAASFISSSVGEDGVYKGLVHYGLVK